MPGGARGRAWSRRWSWPSRACTSCARRCWTAPGTLPVPQRDALRIAFGLAAGPPPDRFLVGLAVLSLLSEVAEERPLVCLIDDAQWLDQASAQVLAFVGPAAGRRAGRLVFAAREPGADWPGCRSWRSRGCGDGDARALLDSVRGRAAG